MVLAPDEMCACGVGGAAERRVRRQFGFARPAGQQAAVTAPRPSPNVDTCHCIVTSVPKRLVQILFEHVQRRSTQTHASRRRECWRDPAAARVRGRGRRVEIGAGEPVDGDVVGHYRRGQVRETGRGKPDHPDRWRNYRRARPGTARSTMGNDLFRPDVERLSG